MRTDTAAFGEALRQFRSAAALSQEALADRSGLSSRGISDLERGVRRAPHLATVRLLADALDLSAADRQTLFAAARLGRLPERQVAAPGGPSPLPTPLTSLIGRERELATLVALLGNADSRLVTLTGAGGTGKTRLALEAGTRLGCIFADGVVFVDLTPLRDASLVLPAIATALGIRERLGQPLRESLSGVLAPQQILLLLDNCEHVLAGASEVAALLTACPRLSVLATSRAALHVRGEREVPLLPLRLPAADRLPSVEELTDVPAVALFVERAATSQPGFALEPDNASAVAAICRRLEGLPLAIELAAAWIRMLPPAALLTRLEHQLPLLTGGSRDLPARQRTMRDAIVWSYDLLAPAPQALFRRLAVFAGGWTLEAAEAVSDGAMDGNVLDGLHALVAASLIQVVEQPDGERRFSLLETVREFGLEQLVACGEAEELGHRHADYYLALAQVGAAALANAVQGSWLPRLEAEQGNFRAALTWLRDHAVSKTGLALAAALGSFWHVRSANAEGRTWLETFLKQATSEPPSTDRMMALRWAGELAGLQGDLTAAEAHLGESLALARQMGDKRGVAAAQRAIGSAKIQYGDVEGGLAPLAEAAALTRELGDLRQTAFLLAYLACAVARQGDQTRAEALVAESDALVRSFGDAPSFELDFVEFAQGWVAITNGDYARAQPRLEAALAIGRTIAAKGTLSAVLACLGEVSLARGDVVSATEQYREGMILGWEGEFPLGIAFNLQGLARVGSRSGALVPVARVVGALDAFAGAMRVLPWLILTKYEAEVAMVRAALGNEGFTAERETGLTLPLEEVIVEAVRLADDLMSRQESRA